jgi:PncC family amidohydrolase
VPDELRVLASLLQERCIERGLTVAVAESCTGGLVAAAITANPGSSAYFLGGVVSYANEAKETLLEVPRATLEAHGAVSREVAEAMARGAVARFGASLAVATTGIAGPDGGSDDKPVGLVYLGLATDGDAWTEHHVFPGDRDAIREAAADAALRLLIASATQEPR